jgi:hypothetical protein
MLPIRTQMPMAIGCGIGLAAGALTYLASRSAPQALLAAGAATGSSADLLRQFIGTNPEHPASERDDTNHDDRDDREDDDGVEQKAA